MRRLFLIPLLLVFLVSPGWAKLKAPAPIGPNTAVRAGSVTMGTSRLTAIHVTQLPGSPTAGDTYWVDDATSACVLGAGGGGAEAEFVYDGSAWVGKMCSTGTGLALTDIDTLAELEAIMSGINIIQSTEIDTLSELETLMSGINIIQSTEIDTLAELNAIIGDATLLDDGAIGASTAIGLNAGDTYSNFGSASDDSLNEMFAAIDTALGLVSGVSTASPIGATAFTDLTAGDSYSNFGSASDDTINELFAALDTAIGGLGGGHDAATLATGIDGLTLTGQEFGLQADLEAIADQSWSPTLTLDLSGATVTFGLTISDLPTSGGTWSASSISPTFGTVTAASFVSSAEDGAHFLDVINTTSITATATAGRAAYYNGRMYLADGSDWDGYFLEDTDIGLPASADGNALGSATLEWSDAYFADGAVIYFGNDQEVYLTHTPDTGLTLTGSMAVTGAITGLSAWGADITGTGALNTTALHNVMYHVTAVSTTTLDAAADAGYGACVGFKVRDAEVHTIDSDDAEKINLDGTATAAGGTISSSGTAGDYIWLCSTTDTDGSGTDGWESWGNVGYSAD